MFARKLTSKLDKAWASVDYLKTIVDDFLTDPELKKFKKHKQRLLAEENDLEREISEKEAIIDNLAQDLNAIKSEIQILERQSNKIQNRNLLTTSYISKQLTEADTQNHPNQNSKNVLSSFSEILDDFCAADEFEMVELEDLKTAIQSLPVSELQAEFKSLKL